MFVKSIEYVFRQICIVSLCYTKNSARMEKISAETEMTSVLFEAILIDNGIIPEVLHDPPKYVLHVTYPPNLEVDFGTMLLPKDVAVRPKIREWYTETDSYYVLVMTGMDEPWCENSTQFMYLYWCIGNIPETNISAGHVYAPYLGPRPRKDTGAHRYVFILYRQPEKLDFDLPNLYRDRNDVRRTCFSTRKFWTHYNLTPTASNFYLSKYNETLPFPRTIRKSPSWILPTALPTIFSFM
ncbi:protein D1 isoform X1 [Bemisia tabaci]|uniref:protein D1 isoform X1 n=2 Tax=Bemisia tabaci TaxID=7038 RepID=UPI003B28385F